MGALCLPLFGVGTGYLNSGILICAKTTLPTELPPPGIFLFFCLSEAYQLKVYQWHQHLPGLSMGHSVPRAALTLQKPGRG